jgi:hypothetical protein
MCPAVLAALLLRLTVPEEVRRKGWADFLECVGHARITWTVRDLPLTVMGHVQRFATYVVVGLPDRLLLNGSGRPYMTETRRTLFGMKNRAFESYLISNDRILISFVWCIEQILMQCRASLV